MAKLHALVVDDTIANRDFLGRLLKTANFDVVEAANGQEALDAIYSDRANVELAVVDMELPDMSGLQLITRLRERNENVLIVTATMHDDLSWIQKSFEAGANIYLVKPHGFMELLQRLMSATIEENCTEDRLIIDQYGTRKYTPATV